MSNKLAICSTEDSSKLLSPEALFLTQNAPKAALWSGSARTRWGAYSAPQIILIWIKGCPRRKGEREGGKEWRAVREEWGGKGWEKERGGKGKWDERKGGGKGKEGGEKGWGREKVGQRKVESDCAVLKIPLKSSGSRPSLTLRKIDAPDG